MKPVRLAPEALGELADAAVWYESRETGLGDRFLDEGMSRSLLNAPERRLG